MPACPRCEEGLKPVWLPHTREWVHRQHSGARFSISACLNPPPPPSEESTR